MALQKSQRLNKVVLADDSPPQKKFTATPVKGTATKTPQKTGLRKFSRQKLISDDSGTDYALKSPSVKLPVAQKIPQSEGKVTGGSSVKVKDRCSICRIVFNTDTDKEIGSLWVKCGWDPCSYWVHATCCGIKYSLGQRKALERCADAHFFCQQHITMKKRNKTYLKDLLCLWIVYLSIHLDSPENLDDCLLILQQNFTSLNFHVSPCPGILKTRSVKPP